MVNWGNFHGFFSTGIPSAVLYPSIIVTIALIVAGVLCGKVRNKVRYTLFILLVEYLFVVLCSTVICRPSITFVFDRLELVPLWTYKCVINHAPGVSVWDIVLNVALFMPLGFLVKLIYPSLSLLKMLGIAVICSLFIEINQYIFEKGVAQTDDVMHNVIGALSGWFIAKCCIRLWDVIYSRSRFVRKL